jgi:hypothetical protein
MGVMECCETKKNLITSKDIYNLLANLYSLCASRFPLIHSLTRNDESYRAKFREYLHRYKIDLLQLLGKTGDIFTTDFSQILHTIETMPETDEENFLIAIWAYFSAIDLSLSDEKIYLNTYSSIPCQASECFWGKKYRLLFKPRNLIFTAIKDECSIKDQIRINKDIGQRIEDRLQNLVFYEAHSSRNIDIARIDPVVDHMLLDQGKNLAFAVAPIYCDYEYSFNMPEGTGYVFENINNKPTISQHIDYILRKCLKNDVHIVVFPELSLDQELRREVSNWLRQNNHKNKIIMVTAGSWHILKDEERQTYVNNSSIIKFDGEVLWEQGKMHQFQLNAGDIKELLSLNLRGFEAFYTLLDAPDQECWEKIEIADTLKIYDSSIGRMAITICLDYFVKERAELLVEPIVNLIFLPAMSPTLNKIRQASFYSGTWRMASVFCANSCWIITGGKIEEFKKEHSSFIYTPQIGGMIETVCTGDCSKCNFPIFRISEISKKSLTNKKKSVIL